MFAEHTDYLYCEEFVCIYNASYFLSPFPPLLKNAILTLKMLKGAGGVFRNWKEKNVLLFFSFLELDHKDHNLSVFILFYFLLFLLLPA